MEIFFNTDDYDPCLLFSKPQEPVADDYDATSNLNFGNHSLGCHNADGSDIENFCSQPTFPNFPISSRQSCNQLIDENDYNPLDIVCLEGSIPIPMEQQAVHQAHLEAQPKPAVGASASLPNPLTATLPLPSVMPETSPIPQKTRTVLEKVGRPKKHHKQLCDSEQIKNAKRKIRREQSRESYKNKAAVRKRRRDYSQQHCVTIRLHRAKSMYKNKLVRAIEFKIINKEVDMILAQFRSYLKNVIKMQTAELRNEKIFQAKKIDIEKAIQTASRHINSLKSIQEQNDKKIRIQEAMRFFEIPIQETATDTVAG